MQHSKNEILSKGTTAIMLPITFLINLAGAVLLLLWSVHLVQAGVETAYGPRLRLALRNGRDGSVQMIIAGMILAVVLQSSTAVGLLAAGFATSGMLTIRAGIAALLGADLGSALVVKILSYDLSSFIMFLLCIGGGMSLKLKTLTSRETGRIIIGIALILVSLKMLGQVTLPMRESPLLPSVVNYLIGDPLSSFLAAVITAFVLHSSVATVLLLVVCVSGEVLPLEVALPMVLGANVGGGMIAVWLTRGMATEARRIPVGNVIFRCAASLLCLVGLQYWELPVTYLGKVEAVQLVNFHVGFNLLLVLLALPLIRTMERLTVVLLAHNIEQTDPMFSVLDRSSTRLPSAALASAKRELLRMGEITASMYSPLMDLLKDGNFEEIARVKKIDQQVNRKHAEIKFFIAELNGGELSEKEIRQGIELTLFCANIEHIGDIISKNVLSLAKKKAHKKLEFSSEGWSELCNLHARVGANLQLALNVLVSGDIKDAQKLIKEKEEIRQLERDSHYQHLGRLRGKHIDSAETSNMHLEIVRAFKEINSLLVSASYPILTDGGLLLKSRLANAPTQN